ncbi:MAG: OmpA family protein [Bacteroidales bacterium]|nr:OmpA family protein [Bacteroidales bacterium]
MKNIFKKVALCSMAALALSGQAEAQLSNSLFFDKYNYRSRLVNPANTYYGKFHIGIIPLIPTIGVEAGVSDLVFGDVFQNVNVKGKKQTLLFCDKDNPGGVDKFLDAVKGGQRVIGSFRIDLLDFGFKLKEGYLSFNLGARGEAYCNIPEKVFTFAFEGMNEGERYDLGLNKLAANSTVWGEFGVGYSRPFGEKLSLGVNLKYLGGIANARTDFSNLKAYADDDEWRLSGDYKLYASVPKITVTENEDGGIKDVDTDQDMKIKSRPGFAVDLGANYQLLPQLKLSASVLDLGFISWKTDYTYIVESKSDYVFNGVRYDFNEEDFEDLPDFENVYKLSGKNKYVSGLTPKMYLGGEYSLWDDRIGLGLVSRTTFYKKNPKEEIFANANFRPFKKLSFTLNYSMFDGHWTNIGWGFNVVAGVLNIYAAFDNCSLKYAKVDDYRVPSNTNFFRFNFGLGLTFKGREKKDKEKPIDTKIEKVFVDSDNDGVTDTLDMCAATPEGVEVDEKGCPLDTDKDGVADYLDKCPDTPESAAVDTDGCLLDSDGDGVPDYLDKCPETLDGVAVDENGCPLDTDKDGVPDYKDRCPDTPTEAKVDENGCPLDTDKDGVPDYLDKCPETYGTVNGCPEIKQEVKQIFKKALNGIQFESGKSTILRSSYPILDQVVKVMTENPDYKLIISGHTDSSGNPEKNMTLSKERADAVKNYLIIHGIPGHRLTAEGYGDTRPVADNKTTKGRALNRRVELEAEY